MLRFALSALCIAMIVVLAACGGSDPSEPLVRIAPTPTPDRDGEEFQTGEPGGLPADWFVVSSDNEGMMLENSREEDSWIWITIESSLRGSDLGEALDRHRTSVKDSPLGTYNDSGSIDTSKHGTARWSWGSFEPEEGDREGKHELALFVTHPRRDTVLMMLYLYPLGETEFSPRLAELVAVADGLEQGS